MLALHADDTRRLLRFNLEVLAQAARLIEDHLDPRRPTYREPVGMHLRHVIEHYEALLHPARPGVVDYDRRPRDQRVEHDPTVALARVQALECSLALWTGPELQQTLRVRSVVGVDGDSALEAVSSFARELVFVASHAIHHYALLRRHCEEHGLDVGPAFGRAPATVAHDRQLADPNPVNRRSPTWSDSTPQP